MENEFVDQYGVLRQTTYNCSHNCRSKARKTKNKIIKENIPSQTQFWNLNSNFNINMTKTYG
jgi:hypothetical protein